MRGYNKSAALLYKEIFLITKQIVNFFFLAPRLIVYDNACNLHSYALNRDPVFFKNTQFLVDRLHWRDHTGKPFLNIITVFDRLEFT